MRLHIAKDGDTIQVLSEKYGVAADRILAANAQLGAAEPLTRGIKVKIPTGPVYMTSAAEAAQAGPAPQAGPVTQAEPVANAVAPSAAENTAANVPALGANDAPPLSGLSPTTPGIAPESFATEEYAAKREETASQTAAVAAAAVEAPAGAAPGATTPAAETPAAELPEPTETTAEESPAAQLAAMTQPTLPTVPSAPAAPQAVETEPLPSYYKTEPAMGDLSPLHVQWSGMNDSPAVHPFAPLPTPVVPAGAPTYFPGPVGFGAMPTASFGAFGGADASAYATYGAAPEPFAQPFAQQPFAQQPMQPFGQQQPFAQQQPFGQQAFPQGAEFPQGFPAYPAPAAHDCGCGGAPAPRLPYALPLREAVLRPEARAYASAAAAQPQTEPQAAPPVEAPAAAPKAEGKRKARSRKKSAQVSGTDRLRSFLKRATAARRPSGRKSKPWVND